MSVRIEFLSEEEKKKIYSKYTKKELISLLITANEAKDFPYYKKEKINNNA